MNASSPPRTESTNAQQAPLGTDSPNKLMGIDMVGRAWDSLPLPSFGTFVGRDRELAELEEFLNPSNANKSIMLVHGPRGVGKSALVCKAAKRARDEGIFNNVIWIDRTWAVKLLDSEKPILAAVTTSAPDLTDLIVSDGHEYVARFLRKRREDEDSLPEHSLLFFKSLLKNPPFLLVIDDFDELDGLNKYLGLCEELAHLQSPNKVVLTSRSRWNGFSQQQYASMEVGLLAEDEVRSLISESSLRSLDPDELVAGDMDATATYFWKVSAGLPEVITRFLIPTQERKRWLLEQDPRWEGALSWFAAGYLVGREQSRRPEDYEDSYPFHNDQLRETLVGSDKDEQYILLSLACEQESLALEEKDLARRLGYRPEDKPDFSRFHEILARLNERRLIGRRIEKKASGEKAQNHGRTGVISKWTLLPFVARPVKDLLLSDPEMERRFRQEQADRWIRFVAGYVESPGRLQEQIDRIHASLSWCVDNQDWPRVISLGEPFVGALFGSLSTEHAEECGPRLVEICQMVADAAMHSETGDRQKAVDMWLLLAEFHANAEDHHESHILCYEYAAKAVEFLKAIEHTDGATNAKQARAKCYMAWACLQDEDVVQCSVLLGEVESAGFAQSDAWVTVVYECATTYRRIGDREHALHWLQKLIESTLVQNAPEMIAKVTCDLANFHLSAINYDQASLLAKQVIGMQGSTASGDPILEARLRARAILAIVAYRNDEKDACIAMLEEARDLAKAAKLDPIAEYLRLELYYVRQLSSAFDPAGGIDKLLGARLQWGYDRNEEKCPICHRSFELEDMLSEHRLWHCQHCGIAFHLKCLAIAVDNNCPACGTPRTLS